MAHVNIHCSIIQLLNAGSLEQKDLCPACNLVDLIQIHLLNKLEGEVPVETPDAFGPHFAAKILGLKTFWCGKRWWLLGPFPPELTGPDSKALWADYTPGLKGQSPSLLYRIPSGPGRSQEAGMPHSALSSLRDKVREGKGEVFHSNLTYCFGQLTTFFAQLKVQAASKVTSKD